MKKRKIVLIVLLCCISVIGVTSCSKHSSSNATRKTIKIAYLPITHALPLFVEAELQEENPEYSIELVKYSSWAELTDALNTGRVDGASLLIELAVSAKNRGIDLKCVALGHKDGNVVIVRNEIQKITDLKGKSFAIPHRQSAHNILMNQMLSDGNMSVEDINVVELAPSEMPSALSTGQIAGYCVAEPFGAKAISMGEGKVLYESSELWKNSACCGLVIRDEFIENNQSVAEKFVHDYKEAGEYVRANQDQAKKIGMTYLKVSEEEWNTSMQWISYDDLAITKDVYDDLTTNMMKYGLSDVVPSYDEFVEPNLYK